MKPSPTAWARLWRACTASPARVALTAAAVTPGIHFLLSVLVERRRPRWSTEYPALTVGDPMLALAAGIATLTAGPAAVAASPIGRAPLAQAVAGAAVAFGAWQLRSELRRGVYDRHQGYSPSKLWHQFGVYPVMSTLLPAALLAATRAAIAPAAGRRRRAGAALAWTGVGVWAALAAHGVRNPRSGHGSFDWRRLRPLVVEPSHRGPVTLSSASP